MNIMETPNSKIKGMRNIHSASSTTSSNMTPSPMRGRQDRNINNFEVSFGPRIYENKVASSVNLTKIFQRYKTKCQWYTPNSKRKNGESNNSSNFLSGKDSRDNKKKNSSNNANNRRNKKKDYNNDPSRMLKLKLKRPAKSKVLLRNNGVISIINCKDTKAAIQVSNTVKEIIKSTGQVILDNSENKYPKLKSISGSVKYDLGIIKLEALEFDDEHYKRCRYTPELFPFLVYKYPYTIDVNTGKYSNNSILDKNDNDNNNIVGSSSSSNQSIGKSTRKQYVTLIIFSNGRMVIKNGEDENHLRKISNEMFDVLRHYAR
jgi:TATA-box binding protein (TBP) (component of TFIID and TFIIIB)